MESEAMKPCVIKQPAGIGDVFFLQKVAHTYREKGCEIIWPLRDDIFWISDYIPNISWYRESDNFPGKECWNADISACEHLRKSSYGYPSLDHGEECLFETPPKSEGD